MRKTANQLAIERRFGTAQKKYSRTYSVAAEDCDGYDTVTVVFGHPIDPDRTVFLDKEISIALKVYYGPDSEIVVAR